jgi:tetratricopeptide (TPR) repeat protein
MDRTACGAHVGHCVIVIGFSHQPSIHITTTVVFANKPLAMFFEDISSIPVELRCGVCAQPWWPETAVVCPKGDCEEIFCRACIEDHLAKSTTCPKCVGHVNLKDMPPPHPLLKSMAMRARVLCPNRPGGCWKGPWGELETHLSACPYDPSKVIFVDEDPDLQCLVCLSTLRAPETCPLCRQIFCGPCLYQSLQRESKCPHCRGELVEDLVQEAPRQVTSMLAKLRVSCVTSCGWIGPRSEYDAHLSECPLRTAVHPSAAVAMSPVAPPNIPAVFDVEPAAPPNTSAAAPIVNGLAVAGNNAKRPGAVVAMSPVTPPDTPAALPRANAAVPNFELVAALPPLPIQYTVSIPVTAVRILCIVAVLVVAVGSPGWLGRSNSTANSKSAKGRKLATNGSRVTNQRELYLEAVRHDGTNSNAYNNLATVLVAGESVTLPDGRAMNQRELLLEATRHKGTSSKVYNNLATVLVDGESVTLPDCRAMNQRELYLEAIRHDGTYSQAYYNLATVLVAGESVTLPNGRAMKKRELYLEAIRHDGTLSSAYYNLATLLAAGEFVTLPNGCAVNERKLYLETIRHDGTNSNAYNNLAALLVVGESVTLPDGRAVNQRELYLEAIRHDGTNSNAYTNLAALLVAGESVTLPDGRAMNQRELYLEAIRHDGTYSNAYNNLATLLAAGESVTLPDGRAMNQRELLLEATRHKGTCSKVYNNLATLLAAGESITLLDGRTMSKRELHLEAIRHGGAPSSLQH